MQELHYFLGANSPTGFYGYFQQAYTPEWHVWLIKGGPGSGKSTLLRRIAAEAGGNWEQVHCSSDPKSLDAVLLPQKKVMVADATAPHSMEALWPGCTEHLVDLGAGFDVAQLRAHTAEVRRLFAENAALHRQAVRYLAAAAQVQQARLQQAQAHLDVQKVRAMALQEVQALPAAAQPGGVSRRGLCAVTPQGVLFYADTVRALAQDIRCLQDDWGAAAPLYMQTLYEGLVQRRFGLYACHCSLRPQGEPEHLLAPAAGMAWVSSNAAHTFTGAGRTVELRDCYGRSRPGTHDALRRLQAQEAQLLEAACGAMYQARLVHDELESYYTRAMDFALVSRLGAQLVQTIRALPPAAQAGQEGPAGA